MGFSEDEDFRIREIISKLKKSSYWPNSEDSEEPKDQENEINNQGLHYDFLSESEN